MLKMDIFQFQDGRENSNQLTLDFLKEVNDYGASRLIYTDINRDGTKQSPTLKKHQKLLILQIVQ